MLGKIVRSIFPPKLHRKFHHQTSLRGSGLWRALNLLEKRNHSCARGPPQFLKKRSENAGSNVNISCGSAAIPGIAPRVAPRIVGFVLISERPFREWNFVFREWNFQFRELLREYPGTLQELREWPFHSESVFPEIGVVPRLLNHTPPCSSAELCFAEKNGVHRGKISVVDMVFLVFMGFLYPPPVWKVFL